MKRSSRPIASSRRAELPSDSFASVAVVGSARAEAMARLIFAGRRTSVRLTGQPGCDSQWADPVKGTGSHEQRRWGTATRFIGLRKTGGGARLWLSAVASTGADVGRGEARALEATGTAGALEVLRGNAEPVVANCCRDPCAGDAAQDNPNTSR
jgi:hypothetical protein